VYFVGPSLITRFKSDLIEKYGELFSDNRIADYLYHCNAQPPRFAQLHMQCVYNSCNLRELVAEW